MTATEIRRWNYRNPNKKQFTKSEHTNAPRFYAYEIWYWNKDLPNAEQYSKDEHFNSPGINRTEMKLWNNFRKNELYSKKEIDDISIIEFHPKNVTEELFTKYNTIINNMYNKKLKSYKQFKKLIKSKNI